MGPDLLIPIPLALAILGVCVLLSCAASAAETALTSVGRFRARHLAESGDRRAVTLLRLFEDPNRYLSTVLVVNTVALIFASSMATVIGLQLLPVGWGFWGDLAVSALLSLFLLIFAEVTPKTLAIRYADRVALVSARPVDWLAGIFRPVIWLITLAARVLTGGRGAHAPYLTERELMTMLHVSEEQGVIEEDEREMIHGIIQFGDKRVREVMIPRPDIHAIPIDADLDEVMDAIRRYGHTRFPVYREDLDHIVGQLNAKDLLFYLPKEDRFQLSELLRPIRVTPEQKKVDELLHEMQAENVHMMVVVDEYGSTAGLVTLEDLIEEIVGEIRDEYDAAEEDPLVIVSPTEAVVDARMSLSELNERLELGVEQSEEYDSLGGYILYQLGEIPKVGDTLTGGRAQMTVRSMTNHNRIGKVTIRLLGEQTWPADLLEEIGMARSQPGPEPEPPGASEDREDRR